MKKNNIVIVILSVLCLALSLFIAMRLPGKSEESHATSDVLITRLKTQNDSLARNNQELDQRLSHYQVRADSLRGKLLGTKHTINQLKQQRHENITRLDSLNSCELYSYFSEFNP